MLKALLSWWLRQLAGALPARWRDAGDDGAATVVSLGTTAGAPGVAEIALRARRGSTHLCRIVLDDAGVATARAALAGRRRPAPVVLRLPQAALLEREVVLPLAAERDPEAVLGFEMDRLTPFRAADVVWQASGFRRDRARQLLSLRLSLLPRSLFADALPVLASLGLVPAAVEVPGPATPDGAGWRRLALGSCSRRRPGGASSAAFCRRAGGGPGGGRGGAAVHPAVVGRAGGGGADRRSHPAGERGGGIALAGRPRHGGRRRIRCAGRAGGRPAGGTWRR